MSVSKMIAGAFEQAAQAHANLHEAWISPRRRVARLALDVERAK